MHCPDCDGDVVVFSIPASIRAYGPDDAETAALCTRCLRLHPAPDAPPEPLTWDPLPAGEAGAAVALVVGRLDSLALARADIEALVAVAEREGADVLLALDRLQRLAAHGEIQPHVDLSRRTAQLESLLE